MGKSNSKRYKQGYSVRASTQFPGALTAELEKMMELHGMKLGPLVNRLALRGLLEYRKDGRLGTLQELGLPAGNAGEPAPPRPADAAGARTAVSGDP
jgi:hypothetical protein